jgi:hypothetical protein
MTTKYIVFKNRYINDFKEADEVLETKCEAVIQLAGYESGSEALRQKVLESLVTHLIQKNVITKSEHTDRLQSEPDYRVEQGYWDDAYLCALEFGEKYDIEIEVLEVL